MKYTNNLRSIERQCVQYILQNRKDYRDLLLRKPYDQEDRDWNDILPNDIHIEGAHELLGLVLCWHGVTDHIGSEYDKDTLGKAKAELERIYNGIVEIQKAKLQAKLERLENLEVS